MATAGTRSGLINEKARLNNRFKELFGILLLSRCDLPEPPFRKGFSVALLSETSRSTRKSGDLVPGPEKWMMQVGLAEKASKAVVFETSKLSAVA